MPLHPTQRQLGYLLSSSSPLSSPQKSKFQRELHSGKVKIKKKGKNHAKGKVKADADEDGE